MLISGLQFINHDEWQCLFFKDISPRFVMTKSSLFHRKKGGNPRGQGIADVAWFRAKSHKTLLGDIANSLIFIAFSAGFFQTSPMVVCTMYVPV